MSRVLFFPSNSSSRVSFTNVRDPSFCSCYIFSSPPSCVQLAVQGRNLLETSFLSTSSLLRLSLLIFFSSLVPASSFSKFKVLLFFVNIFYRSLPHEFFVSPCLPFAIPRHSCHFPLNFAESFSRTVLELLSTFYDLTLNPGYLLSTFHFHLSLPSSIKSHFPFFN